jgi:hypothetical protein
MSIHDFHSKLSSRNENNTLFEALRRLRRIEDIRSLMFSEETVAGGWYPWADEIGNPQHVVAEG